MTAVLAITGFAVVMWLVNRAIRKREADGDFDVDGVGPPGLRWFFDWRGSGKGQRPPPS